MQRSMPNYFIEGMRDCITLSLAGIVFGLAFGVLAHVHSMSFLHSLVMSASVYAGTAQMVSLAYWHINHLPLLTILLTTSIICMRFFLMSMTLYPVLHEVPKWKIYLGLLLLVDECWALTLIKRRKVELDHPSLFQYYLGAAMAFYLAFVIGTPIGYYLGNIIHDPSKFGIDFALIAIFLALLIGMWRGKADAVPWFIAGATAVVFDYFLPGAWHILVGALVGSIVGAWRAIV